jgi:intein/homing endonuclease
MKLVQIQTISHCNGYCIFCPYPNSWMVDNPGSMDHKLYNKILINLNDDYPKFDGKFCPYLMNEPFCDNTIINKIQEAYDVLYNPLIEISTNASVAYPKYISELKEIIKNKRIKLVISLHGIDEETHIQLMDTDWEISLNNTINILKELNDIPISIQSMSMSTDHKHKLINPRRIQRFWYNIFDDNNINTKNINFSTLQFHNRAGGTNIKPGNFIYRKIDKNNPFDCTRLHDNLHVLWNGDVVLCCVPPDTKVLNSNLAFKNINEFKPGDYVISHTGKKQKVTDTFSRQYNGNLINIKCSNFNEPLKLTPEHKILTLKRKYRKSEEKQNNIEWIEAKDITRQDYIVVPKIKRKWNRKLNVRDLICPNKGILVDKKKNKIYAIKVNKTRKRYNKKLNNNSLDMYLKIDEDIMWLFGIYLAEGYISFHQTKSGKVLNGITFCLNLKTEQYLADKLLKILKDKFGIKGYLGTNPTNNNLLVYATNRPLAYLFETLFGKYADKKSIHPQIMRYNNNLLYNLLLGFKDGDGCDNNTKWRLVSTSKMLSHQLYVIHLLNGMVPSILSYKQREKKPYYEVTYNKSGNKMVLSDKYNYYFYIKKIIEEPYNGYVYNLEVEKDESYLATIYSIHNCMDYNREVVIGNLNNNTIQEIYNSKNWKHIYNQCTGKEKSPDDFICKRCSSPGG